MSATQYPTARLIALGDDMMKYKPEFTELTADNMKSFLTDFFDGKVRVGSVCVCVCVCAVFSPGIFYS